MRFPASLRLSVISASTLLLALLLSMPAGGQPPPKSRYAGIEISSTAVRAVVIEYQADGSAIALPIGPFGGRETRTGLITFVEEVEQNGKTVKLYRPTALTQVAETVKDYFIELSDKYQVSPDRFYVVASSGAATGADNLNELVKLLQTMAPALPRLTTVSAEDELRLAIVGVLPADLRLSTLLVDSGGSNTKIGLLAERAAGKLEAQSREVKFGTNTFHKRALGLADETRKAFPEAVEIIRSTEVVPQMKEAVKLLRQSETGRKRDQVYVIGGAPYTMATLMFPTDIDKKTVSIQYGKLQEYKQKLRDNPAPPFGPYGPLPEDEALRKKAEKEFDNINKKFNSEQLLSAACLLESVFEALELNQYDKAITFARDSLYAWTTEYVKEQSNPPAPPKTSAVVPDATAELLKHLQKLEAGQKIAAEKLEAEQKLLSNKLEAQQKSVGDKIQEIEATAKRLSDAITRMEAQVATLKAEATAELLRHLQKLEAGQKIAAENLVSEQKLLSNKLDAQQKSVGDKIQEIEATAKRFGDAITRMEAQVTTVAVTRVESTLMKATLARLTELESEVKQLGVFVRTTPEKLRELQDAIDTLSQQGKRLQPPVVAPTKSEPVTGPRRSATIDDLLESRRQLERTVNALQPSQQPPGRTGTFRPR